MKPKPYPLIVLLLALVVFGLKPGPVVATEPTAHESAAQTCVMIQRSTFGEVADGYIWSTEPEISYNYSVLNVGYLEGGEKRSLVRFGLDFLPPGAVVQSALFGIWENTPGSGETVGIYRITEPWTEGEPTWNSFADSYDDAVEWGSFVAGGSGFVVGDVTALASAWVEGEAPNYGLMLLKSSGQMLDSYASSEAGSTGPWLALCYEVNNDPVAEDDSATTDEDTPVTIDVLDNDFDPDGDPLTLDDYDASSTQGGTVTCTVAGECTYTPAGDFNGSDTFGYTAGVVDDWMYEQLAASYVFDEQTSAFLRKSNPWALRGIAERLLEAADRGLWAKPDDGTVEALQHVYLELEEELEGDEE